jgi:hypothetical protein
MTPARSSAVDDPFPSSLPQPCTKTDRARWSLVLRGAMPTITSSSYLTVVTRSELVVPE